MKIKNRILAIILVLSMSILTAFVPSYSASAANQNNSVTYYKYDGSGNYISAYTLSQVSTISNNAASLYSLVGDDDRVIDFSKNGVVQLGSNGGTGFVVDEHTIATAAHCVYSKSSNACIPVTEINFYSSDSTANSDPIKTITAVESVHIPKLYVKRTDSEYEYDYALITVEDDLSDYMCFNLGIPLDGIIDSTTQVYVTGFPGEDFENMYTGSGSVIEFADYTLDYTVDMTGGQSGAPVYTVTTFNNKVYYTVIEINTYSAGDRNFGTCMTTDLLHFYLNNSNL